MIIVYLAVYLGIGLCVGYFGRHRRLGFFGWALLPLVFFPVGPFLALVILFLTKEREPVNSG